MDEYLKDIAKTLGFAAGVAALPLIVAFAKLQPPWPPAIEYLSSVFILMAALAMWEWGRNAKRVVRRRLILAGMALTMIGIGAYLPLYSMFVQVEGSTGERIIKGMVCTPDAFLIYPQQCPQLPSEALPSVQWDATQLWTQNSILKVRMMLVAAWLCFTAGLVAFVGAVIAGRPTGKKPAASS
ncbi:MAG: hypothetical protein J7500_14560 [Sphingomonas sp.]|uniref:hypothetical protein n=1 Tax=Sphingomonas sp. TaxID=28214 RepID=UPI001B00AE5C|nr:hypothetical protein [Sphingomonas sp.]MBO9623928.1 hypothetical protein [Sphingomonas sp.]